jgi:hypothetical protein
VTGGMEEETRNGAPAQQGASAAASSNLGATLLRVAWLAILLGMAMEGILLVAPRIPPGLIFFVRNRLSLAASTSSTTVQVNCVVG